MRSKTRLIQLLCIAFFLAFAGQTFAQFQPWGSNQQRDEDRDRDRDRDRDDRGGQFPPRWGRGRTPQAGACFYKEANFRGDYFCLRPGENINNLPSGFNDRISSVRLFGNTAVNIFSDSNFRGTNAAFNANIPNLARYSLGGNRSWNDRVSSIRVEVGRGYAPGGYGRGPYDRGPNGPEYGGRNQGWNQQQPPRDGACFYKDGGFTGESFCAAQGQSIQNLPSGFNDQITSIRVFGRGRVSFWQNSNFQGARSETNRSIDDLRYWQGGQWNDRISSIQVR